MNELFKKIYLSEYQRWVMKKQFQQVLSLNCLCSLLLIASQSVFAHGYPTVLPCRVY